MKEIENTFKKFSTITYLFATSVLKVGGRLATPRLIAGRPDSRFTMDSVGVISGEATGVGVGVGGGDLDDAL